MSDLSYSQSIVVGAPPEAVYDLVSDVTRTGEWSPICTACWWDEGAGPQVGSWFTGSNEVPGRTWETRSQVVAADRGREFAFVVGGAFVRWGFTMAAVPEGTRLTESWQFLPEGVAMFHERWDHDAAERVAERTRQAHEGIPVTLAAVKRIAEGRMSGGVGAAGDARGNGLGEGGEPACLLHRVCPDCGRLADSEPPTTCHGCGRELLPA